MSIAQTVQDRIKSIPPGRIFGYRDLPDYARSPGAVIKTVGRMVADKRLERLSKGKFYVPRYSKLLGNKLGPSEGELIRSLVYKDGRLRGYVTSLALYNALGLSPQVPVTYTLAINGSRFKKRDGFLRVDTVTTRAPIEEKNVRLLQYLDVLRNIDRIMDSNLDLSLVMMSDYIAKLSDRERSRMAELAVEYYNPRTRAILGLLLSSRQLPVPENLPRSLNPATTYKLRLDKEKWPLAREWNIRR